MECNKNFFLQWDLSYGNDIGSYNGGRFFEWIVSMLIGTVVPLASLRLGQDLAKLSSKNNEAIQNDINNN
jgi:hypothetical protein